MEVAAAPWECISAEYRFLVEWVTVNSRVIRRGGGGVQLLAKVTFWPLCLRSSPSTRITGNVQYTCVDERYGGGQKQSWRPSRKYEVFHWDALPGYVPVSRVSSRKRARLSCKTPCASRPKWRPYSRREAVTCKWAPLVGGQLFRFR